jgi:hypothetical protein
LDYLLKGLEKRDPQQFFAWPVTDHIAPGYSQIIHQPMDFSTMKQKIDELQYSSLNEYIVRWNKVLLMLSVTLSDKGCSSRICIVTGCGLDNSGVKVLVGSRTFTSSYHPDWLWGPLKLPIQ